MRLVFGLVLIVGIGLAGTAVFMARDFFNQQQAQLAAAEAATSAIVPTADVLVVNKQMRYGQKLTKSDVKMVRWPQAAVPKGSFTSVEELFPANGDLRSVLRTMEADEAILQVKVTEPGRDAGVSSRLSAGKRAFAIRTDVTSGVSGFLRPGDRVDVYWTGRLGDRDVTQLIQSTVKLIAIDQSADEDRQSPVVARTVTVEVDPTQVALLAQAQATGRLSLSLVGAEETEMATEDVTVDLQDVLGIEEAPQQVAEQEKKCYVRRRQGEETIAIEIPCTN